MKNKKISKLKTIIYSSILICSYIFSNFASAQNGSLNCDRDFAQIGDAKFTIIKKCGQPVFKDTFCKSTQIIEQSPVATEIIDQRIIVGNPNSCEQVEEWTYTPGSGQFVTLLIFQEGTLKSIRYAGRLP